MLSEIVSLLNGYLNRRQIKKSNSTFGNGIICGRMKILNRGGNITVGDGYKINSGKGYNPIGGDTVCRLICYGGKIIIGNRVGISNSTIVSRDSVTIEDDVFIGGSCKIYDNDYHPIQKEERVSFEDRIPVKHVMKKKGAFIGSHTIILNGSMIGENSVIGAGSVVAGTIPACEIWGGNPAHFIKKL